MSSKKGKVKKNVRVRVKIHTRTVRKKPVLNRKRGLGVSPELPDDPGQLYGAEDKTVEDTNMVIRALKQHWPLGQGHMAVIVQRAMIAFDRSAEAKDDRALVKFVDAFIRMDAQNVKRAEIVSRTGDPTDDVAGRIPEIYAAMKRATYSPRIAEDDDAQHRQATA